MSLPTRFQHTNRKLEDDPQSSTVDLEQLVFSVLEPAALLKQAALLAIETLPIECCLIWKIEEGRTNLLLAASAGIKEEADACIQIPLDPNSLEAYALSNRYPVIVENAQKELRFKLPDLIEQQDMVCGLSSAAGPLESPFGLIEIFSSQVQTFEQEDVNFFRNLTHVAGILLHRERLEENWESQNRLLRKELAELRTAALQSAPSEWDRIEIKNRLIEGRERERLRLAQELHDIPIQDLYGLIYQLDDLRDGLQDPENQKIVEECDQILHRVVNSLRNICRELRPPSLSPFGLEVAIRDHVGKFREQNPAIHVHLDLMRDKQELSDNLRLGLFRIYQQVIQNVAQHAHATEVRIRFYWNDQMIFLEVEDNGQGFEVPRHWVELVRKGHFGLVDIAEGINSMDGKLEVVSAPASGTLVRVIVPRS
jgi:signal transduction histidine kinase